MDTQWYKLHSGIALSQSEMLTQDAAFYLSISVGGTKEWGITQQ